MPKIAIISAEYVRSNRYFMGELSLQQQKIWFMPFLALPDDTNQLEELKCGHIVVLSLDRIREFLNSKQANKELKRTIMKAFALFDELHSKKKRTNIFSVQKIEKGYAYFRVGDLSAVSNFYKGKQYYKFDLNEISAYKNKNTIPLLWYCIAHRHFNSQLNCWEVEFGDKELKLALGLNRYDYVYFPDNQREFYIEAANYISTTTDGEDMIIQLLQKSNFANMNELKSWFEETTKSVHFKRWDFEQKVLLPAITELNTGTMINFVLQTVLKRSEHKNEKAIEVKSYIGKNYVIENKQKKLVNYRKLEGGKQYKFHIAK